MPKYLLLGLVGILFLVIVACGAPDVATPRAGTAAPTATTASAAPAATTAPTTAAGPATLQDVAARLAGGPGSIYVGDLSQLVGPAPGGGLGDENGNVPLAMLEKNSWIFQTDYYRSLIDKANLTNPTEVTSTDEDIDIEYACIDRNLLTCVLQIEYFVKNLLERTNGQVDFEVRSYPELGLARSDMIELIDNGTISFAQIQPAYVGGILPLVDIIFLWGLWKDPAAEHNANTSILPDLDAAMEDETDGGKLIYHIWYGGDDQYFFADRELRKPADFDGLDVSSHGNTMTYFIQGLGGEVQSIAFSEVYDALDEGILDAGLAGAQRGFDLQWFSLSDYLVGPTISLPMGFETMNETVWGEIPADLQAVIIEEGAKMELENLRLAAVWAETGVKVNVEAGMEFIPYDDDMNKFIFEEVALGRVLPRWIKRVDQSDIDLFNNKVAPYAGVRIEADGSVTMTGN